MKNINRWSIIYKMIILTIGIMLFIIGFSIQSTLIGIRDDAVLRVEIHKHLTWDVKAQGPVWIIDEKKATKYE